jgi:23S rRNA pseudouridine2605 synthase
VSNATDFSTEQLAAARATAWHQAGTPLLTLDALRDFVTANGIVLFAPRPLQLPAPAPSLVEAMIGSPSAGPTDGQIATTRSIVARLVAEGNALPLNLLGMPGDLPDFVVSAQVFSFIYTLRGDKAWKLPPTSVTPLSLRIFEVLTEKGALSAAEIATELGRELTESAVQRSLTELWSNLRVLPLLDQGNGPTLWELTSRRFTKAIKAGINAGQPTALSALISLYLAQALLASEDEVETYLSPLAARSRIREVSHALTGSRQLETIVLEGKSLMVIPGTLPEFPEIEKPEPTEEELAAAATIAAASLEGEGRIKKFSSSSERRSIGDFKGKPARTFGTRPAGGSRPTPRFGAKPAFGAKPDGERRPFSRDSKPTFTKPWEENRKPRAEGEEGAPPKRPYTPRAANAGSSFARKPYTPRDNAAGGSSFPKRPYTPRAEGGEEAPKRPYTPRAANAGSTFAKKPWTPRESGATTGSYPKRPYTPRDNAAASDRPARPSFGAKRTFGDKPTFGSKPSFGAKRSFGDKSPYAAKRPFTPREDAGGDRPAPDSFTKFRKFDAPKRPFTPREGGRPDKPAYGGSNSKPRAPKPPREDFRSAEPTGAPKRPFPRKEGDLADRPERPWPAKTGRSDGRPGGPGSKPRAPRKDFAERPSFSDRPARPSFGDRGDRPARPSFGSKPFAGKSFGAKNGEGRSFASKPGGFSKRPAASGDKVSFGSKPAPRRGTPGVKPSFPRKPRPEHTEE